MYLVRTGKGKLTSAGYQYLPGLTLWWQGFAAGCVDFTREESRNWWSQRLDQIRDKIGIDSFKFDAGESNWLPDAPVFDKDEDKRSWPGIYSTRYVEHVARFGGMVEVRTARHSQHLPIFVRMLDKNSRWGYDNGLKSMVTTLLQFSMTGYPFVLPDMVGGNGYLGLPSRELYVRWMQVNVFMPAIQISYVPWIYDDEVVKHTRDMVQLHEKYASEIIRLAKESKTTGLGINLPIWWLDPTDKVALTIDSEFLLGSTILVAPVLERGAVTRDIYLPAGNWTDMVTNETVTGPTWLTEYPADLFTLPYFVKQS
jgi:alpha-glucosidase (family GH31 glycosyl hydrolase)